MDTSYSMAVREQYTTEMKIFEKRTNYSSLHSKYERKPGFKINVGPLVINVFGEGIKEMK